jgi:hypothetical protein
LYFDLSALSLVVFFIAALLLSERQTRKKLKAQSSKNKVLKIQWYPNLGSPLRTFVALCVLCGKEFLKNNNRKERQVRKDHAKS